MSRRLRSVPEAAHMEVEEEEEVQEPPPETRRTRSGRRVRTPAALLDSEEPPRTPTRRTRRTVLQELPAVEETNTGETEHKPEAVPEEKSVVPAEPEPCTGAEPAGGDAHVPRPAAAAAAAAETVPAGPETVPETVPKKVPKKKARLAPSVKQNPVIPLGKPKSGRVWKDRSKQRFSALVRDKPLCTSWEKKMQAKQEKDMVKKFTTQLKDDKAKQKEDKRKRREDNLKRRTENERKSEIVQVIRNTAKIKRMKKKQLRKIEKRDTLALLQKTQKQRVKAKAQKNPVKDLT
ncbi:coiled-coil domain-containing protein 86 [Hippoglossus hippoglossus]|uniref:coiled-coil domain-containing protein 86 n=1 Tax=Hippoglossus hippoglossus TaxID=8267 RepID=UPI00148B45DF|nr:coiled-coil domain-containing protein 86 [Hippoglossus hippoglossus]